MSETWRPGPFRLNPLAEQCPVVSRCLGLSKSLGLYSLDLCPLEDWCSHAP